MRRDAKTEDVDADDPHPADLFRQQVERNAGGGRHTQVDHDNAVVGVGLGGFEDRPTDVLEHLALHQGLGIERDIADRPACPVKVRGEGQPIDAARRAAQDRRGAPHPQPDAQRTKGRAHRLRLVVRPARVVVAQPRHRLAAARRRGGGKQGFMVAMTRSRGRDATRRWRWGGVDERHRAIRRSGAPRRSLRATVFR